MKTLVPILLLIFSAVALSQQQQPAAVQPPLVIESVAISGIPDSRLSPELNADIQKLVNQTFNAAAVAQLAEGIQIELPEYVAAVTTLPGSQPDKTRVVLVVQKISDNNELKTNINSRYTVDSVDVTGSYKARISDGLKSDLQSMVGKNLDNKRADELRDRILNENTSEEERDAISITRKLRRSDSPQHMKILYEVNKRGRNDVGFNFHIGSGGTYHSRQGFRPPDHDVSAYWSRIPGKFRFVISNDPNPLIERFAGWTIGYNAGTRTIRFNAAYSSFRTQWKENTLQAAAQTPGAPGLYRLRDTIDTYVRFTLPRQVKLTGGVELIELQMQSPVTGFQKSRVLKGSLEGNHSTPALESGTVTHTFKWNYDVRTGTRELGSDFAYTRHQLTADYTYAFSSKSWITTSFLAGRAGGNAPMFERFSLGNVTRLRGWNKYEINPLGGNRVLYGSGSYTYSFVTGFYDIGSAWDGGQNSITRQSVGFTLYMPNCKGTQRINPLCWVSVTAGFPIHGGGTRPSLIRGM
jgi:hypothetical protein